MPWPRRFLGLPLHPMLVHFPLCCWVCAPVFDVLALAGTPRPEWWRLAGATTIAGVIVGAAAVVTGLLDYIFLSDTGSSDVRLAARHGVRTSLVWFVMTGKMIVVTVSSGGRNLIASCLIVDCLACALLLQAMFLGTKIVYRSDR